VKSENTSKSLQRAISIFHCFSPNELEFSVNEICQKTKIPKATAYRIIKTLIEARLIERDENTGKCKIGPELFLLGSLFLSGLNIVKIAEPVVKMLTELTNEAFHIGILDNSNMVLLMREECTQPIKVALPLGAIRPAYASGMGKVLLSELKRDLKKTGETGVSLDVWGANEGATGIASVIRDASGKAVAAVGVAVPDSRLNHAERDKFAKVIKLGANLISYGLGFKNKDNSVHDFEEIRYWWQQNQVNLTNNMNLSMSTKSRRKGSKVL